MASENELMYLLTILKVFDVNFVVDEDYDKVEGLNPNNPSDVVLAVEALVMPEFESFSPATKQKLLAILCNGLKDQTETFKEVFEQIEPIFETELFNTRSFIVALLSTLKEHGYGQDV